MPNALALVIRIVVIAIGLWVATLIVPGIDVGAATTATGIGTLLGVALIFGIVNAVLKPIIKRSSSRSSRSCCTWPSPTATTSASGP
jgi:putative membrane protein